jgi:opacity protein-like surface antigen
MTSRFPILLSLALLVLALTASPAHAQTSRIYFAGYLGLHNFNDMEFSEKSTSSTGTLQIENSSSFAGALGIRLSQQLRLEGEYTYASGGVSRAEISGVGNFAMGGELQSKVIFANLYYDFDVPWKIQPFLGGGLGYGWHSAEIVDGSSMLTNSSGDAAGVMWNFGGGIKYRPRTDMAFTAGYRYVDAFSDMSYGNYDINLGSHEMRVGLEWDLPIAGQ